MGLGGFGENEVRKLEKGSQFLTVTIARHERGEGDSFTTMEERAFPVAATTNQDFREFEEYVRALLFTWNKFHSGRE